MMKLNQINEVISKQRNYLRIIHQVAISTSNLNSVSTINKIILKALRVYLDED